MQIDILTLFPEMFKGPFSESIIKKAQEKKIVKINIHNLRNWAKDKHKTVDDCPYGGGAGMVMRVDVIDSTLQSLKLKIPAQGWSTLGGKNEKLKIILLTPQGKVFNQKIAQSLSQVSNLILICGHYEGFDERIREHLVDEEISIGDYILTGGELPAMVLVDAVVRLLPGVLGKKESLDRESFAIKSQISQPKAGPPRAENLPAQGWSASGGKSQNLLEYPQYTRPEAYTPKSIKLQDKKSLKVPKVLLSGNHKEIEKWRTGQALKRTKSRRPDLLQ